MRKLCLLFLLSTTLQAAIISDEQINSLGNSVDKLIEVSSNIAEDSSKEKSGEDDKKWKPTGYVTSLGLTSNGKAGILGFKGTAMAEIYWQKKKEANGFIKSNAEKDQTEAELSDLSEAGINESLDSLMAIAKGSKKIENLEKTRVGLKEKLTEFATLVRHTHADQNKPWYLSAIRFDLVINASGSVSSTYTAGAALSLRVVWVPVKAKGGNGFAKGTGENSLSNMVEDLVQVLAEIPDSKNIEAKGLKLKTVRFGLGASVEGKVSFGKADSSLIFSVMMDKNPKYKPQPDIDTSGMKNDHLAISDGSDVKLMDWNVFKKGIERSLKLSRIFIRKTVNERKEEKRTWEITQIRAAYTVNLNKGVNLVSVGETSQLQMFYKK